MQHHPTEQNLRAARAAAIATGAWLCVATAIFALTGHLVFAGLSMVAVVAVAWIADSLEFWAHIARHEQDMAAYGLHLTGDQGEGNGSETSAQAG